MEPSQSLEDRLEDLREQAEHEYPTSWVPEAAGDEIGGELVRYERGTTRRGEEHWIAVLRAPDESERSVWLLHTALLGQFKDKRPKPGEAVLIRFEGKRESAAGVSYAAYRVEVARDPVEPDWDKPAESDRESADADGDAASGVGDLHKPLPLASSDDDVPF